jgi:hypothetical protein
MTIKYGEIYAKHNTENLWTSTVFWFGYDEQTVSEDSIIIVKFADGDVQEVSKKSSHAVDKNIEFKNYEYIIPSIFSIKRGDRDSLYFKLEPKINNDGIHTLVFQNIFKNYEHYDSNNNITSYFNCIYYRHKAVDCIVKKENVFSILRVKSSISSPRYQIAYDSDDFSKEEIQALINRIFRQPL